MWDASVLVGGNAPGISHAFRLANELVGANQTTSARLPVTQFTQSAAKFAADQTARLEALKANQQAEQEKWLRQQALARPPERSLASTATSAISANVQLRPVQPAPGPTAGHELGSSPQSYTALGARVTAPAAGGGQTGTTINLVA